MSFALDRQSVAHAAIAVGVSVAAWMVLVKPATQEAANLRATLAAAKLQAAESAPHAVEAAASRMAEVRSRLGEICRRNALGNDSSRLYGLVMDMAATHDVQIQSLQPGGEGQTNKDSRLKLTRMEMMVTGRYSAVAGFVDAVTNLDAYIRPCALDMAPLQDGVEGSVAANVAFEVLSFDVPDVLAAVGATDDVQP